MKHKQDKKILEKQVDEKIYILNEFLNIMINNYDFSKKIKDKLINLLDYTSDLIINDKELSDYDIDDVKMNLTYYLSK